MATVTRERTASPLPAPDTTEKLASLEVRFSEHEEAVLNMAGEPTGEMLTVEHIQLVATFERDTGTSKDRRTYRASFEDTERWFALAGTQTALDKALALIPTG